MESVARIEYVKRNGAKYALCEDCGQLFPLEDLKKTATGYACTDCLIKDYDECAYCCEWFKRDNMRETRDGLVCDDCVDNYYYTCDGCGQLVCDEDSIYTDDGYTYCPDCDDEYFYCNDCQRYYSNRVESYETHDGRIICSCCYESNYGVCEDCGEIFHMDDLYYNDYDNSYYCEYCDEQHGDRYGDYRIKDYHDAPALEFYGDSDAPGYIGFELESDKGENFTEAIDGIEDAVGDRVYFEHDGSLDSGFETISHPHTYAEYFSGNFNIKDMLSAISDAGFTSHDAGTCGLHFHLSRTLFGDEASRETAIAKLIYFYDRFYGDIVRISRRTDSQLHWCGKHDADTREKAIDKAKFCRDRYHAVNTTNRNTIEIRIMRGTLNYNTFMASLDFVYKTAINATLITWDDVDDVEQWLSGLNSETIEYIKGKGAFTYARAINENNKAGEVVACA